MGPWDAYGDFRQAAAGAGVVPWVVDYDAVEEDLFLLMTTQAPPTRRIPAAGARHVVQQVREQVWEDHPAAEHWGTT